MTATSSPGTLTDAAHLFALCGFAVAQPLFDLLGNDPTFFVAHDVEGADLVVVALGVLVVPPLVLFAVLTTIRFASDALARMVRIGLAGTLTSLTLAPPLDRAIGLSTAAWIVVTIALALAAAFVYAQWRNARTFVTYVAPAPVLFLVLFLLVSPARTLVLGGDPAAVAVDLQGTRTPIVVLVFDEFPLGALLDPSGRIDTERFPGFARLASTSTWYSSATTVSKYTAQAVPAIATGILPIDNAVPVASSYPRSLFTLFGRSHTLHGSEAITHLCPEDLCRDAGARSEGVSLASDLETVYLRALLPDATADDWGVASIESRWAGFDEATTPLPEPTGSEGTPTEFFREAAGELDAQNQIVRFDEFLASLGTTGAPGLWFHHSSLPHTPYEWVPERRAYNGRGSLASPFLYWPSDPEVVEVGAQRLVLQTMVVDGLVDALLDRLEDRDLLDDAMLVVTADHGVSFLPGGELRSIETPEGRDGVLPIPLFVKYPGQNGGMVDERDARTIDVLPTIVDALGVDVPGGWHFDGRSLRLHGSKPRPIEVVTGGDAPELVTIRDDFDPARLATYLDRFLSFSAGDADAYRIGPHGALVGEAVQSLPQAPASGRVRADSWGAYDGVDLDGVVPALFEATVTGADPGQWVAVALNGTIAGVGPVYDLNDQVRVVALLDPAFLRAGANTVDVYRIDSAGTLHPLTPER